ncbi:MAG TPA: MarR family transcriptional regulator [Gaiellaceae bacterium]|jgi:DNA-binding MarR family transcriptional regulator|nr:MarR family transcriptional regulator [Gaiellaceae bacterium]
MLTSKPVTDEDFAAAARLREALRAFHRKSDEVSAANGLTSRTYQLLLMIKTARSGNGHATLRELEQRLQLGKSTITELTLRTEKRGLVRRELDRNRPGAIVVRLTPAGERRLASAVGELGDERRHLVEVLSNLR